MNGPDQVPVKVVKREIAFSAAARHDNIVRLLDVFAEKAQLIIVVRGARLARLELPGQHPSLALGGADG
ncbi:protein kinase domain-containing protein, partial [Haematococcus lacustris]